MGNIIDILEYIKKNKSIQTDKELATLLKVKPNTVSNWRTRGTIPSQGPIERCI